MTRPLPPLRSLASLPVALVALGGLASAQLTPVGPFTGTTSEGFETQNTSGDPFPPCVVDRVFANQADLCSATGGAFITAGWTSSCTMQEQAGARFYGSTGGASLLTFDHAVTRFGGYFGTHTGEAANGVVHFYDGNGALLFSDVIVAPNDCTWTWNGWDFGLTPIRSMEIRSNTLTGSLILLDSLEADIGATSAGVPFCSCDGTGSAAPCGNIGEAGRGCKNSTGSSAALGDSGLPSVSGAAFYSLKAVGLLPMTPGLYFEGKALVMGGLGAPFGDGLRCAGGQIQRLEVVVSSGSGQSISTVNIPATTSVSSGETRFYQLWYRDPGGSLCGSGFNLTNGLAVTWQP